MDLTTLIIVLLITVAVAEAIKTIKNNRPVGPRTVIKKINV